MITQAELKQLLHYEPDVGLFWWKERPNNKSFNTRHAGKIAGAMGLEGYGRIVIHGRTHLISRLAWLYMTGSFPAGDIDHINTSRIDNSFVNLREATRSQNCANRKARNQTGFKGVSQTSSGKFEACVKKNGMRKRSKSFDTPEEAHSAYKAMAAEIHGEFARAA